MPSPWLATAPHAAHSPRPARAARATGSLAALVSLIAACGGSTTGSETGDRGTAGGGAATGGASGSGAGQSAAGGGTAGGSGGAPDCSNVDCALVDCPAATHPELLPGDCCPTCVSDTVPDDLCRAGQDNLFETLNNNLGEQIEQCTTTAECVVVDVTRCGTPCHLAVNVQHLAAVEEFLIAYAEDNCSTCPETTCPDLTRPPVCTGGFCAYLLVR